MTESLSLLIIDDSGDDRELYRRLLHEDGSTKWHIEEACDGSEALAVQSRHSFDAILLDYSLPGRDGLKVLKDMKNVNNHAAIVMLTGQGNEKVDIQAMKIGAQDYLVKNTITRESLQTAIHHAIEHVQLKRALERQYSLELFANILAHDLVAPIRMMRQYSEFIDEALEAKKYADVKSHCARINQAGRRIESLINTLHDYNKANGAEPEMGPVSLSFALADALENLSVVIKERGAVVTFDALPEVWGNRPQLTQLLQNLVCNGIKYCEAEVPRLHVSACETSGGWQVYVDDNGIGIDPKYHEQIFKPFQRLHAPGGKYSGSGLGLATCKIIVNRHGGRIICEPRQTGGSRFTFTLTKEALHGKTAA